MKYANILWCLIIVITLSSCALFNSNKSKASGKTKLPKVTTATPPGGTDKNWRYLGMSDDGQLIDEINDTSITSNQPQLYYYQDRKTVATPDKFTSYLADQPHYKYLVSNWQMNCNDKSYIILNTTLYNESAVQLATYDYRADTNVKWIKIGSSSLAELQYEYICLNKNRNLGY